MVVEVETLKPGARYAVFRLAFEKISSKGGVGGGGGGVGRRPGGSDEFGIVTGNPPGFVRFCSWSFVGSFVRENTEQLVTRTR